MVEKTIELTEDQLKRVEQLEANDISVGQAIDMLFEVQDKLRVQSNNYIDDKIAEANAEKASLEEQIKKIDDEIVIFNKLKDTSMDFNQKQEILEKEYGSLDETYEMQVQKTKRNVSWARDFFKF